MSRNDLESFYENELAYIRKLGSEFAKKRPKIAGRLLLKDSSGISTDPHVERLIEAFAFLTARTRLKIEDDFPELTESLLGVLYPHYSAPVPSCAVAQFEVDPERGKLPSGYKIQPRSRLYTHEVNGVACRFRTVYPVTLWPVEVRAARYQTPPFGQGVPVPPNGLPAKALVSLELQTAPGMRFSELLIDKLRFFLSGDDQPVHRLYDLLFNHVTHIIVRGTDRTASTASIELRPSSLAQVGFGADEGLLPYSARSFLGYRLLTEYFSFPSKFLFFDVCELERLRSANIGERLEILFYFDRSFPNLETQVNANTFRLGCTPVVNLFEQDADPIRLTQTKSEYLVLPDVRNHWAMETYSVDAVQSTDMETQEVVDYQPFYSFKHAKSDGDEQAYWIASRRPSQRANDRGTEVYLSLVNLNFDPTSPPAEVLSIRTTCSNRDLPRELRSTGGEDWEFHLEGQSPVRKIRPVVQPTAPRRLQLEDLRWRLLSHLSLNHLSITDSEDGAEALRELLRLYHVPSTESRDELAGDGSRVNERHIQGILSVQSARKVARISDGRMQGFCRGVEITLTVNEEDFSGSSIFLFAAVLERFFGLYTSINSATSLVVKSNLREGFQKRWPFRIGSQSLL